MQHRDSGAAVALVALDYQGVIISLELWTTTVLRRGVMRLTPCRRSSSLHSCKTFFIANPKSCYCSAEKQRDVAWRTRRVL
jgi:hypothetical protein